MAVGPDDPSALLELGLIYASHGRLEDAATALGRGLELDPENQTARFNYARVLLAAGRAGAAVGQLERLAHSDPDDFGASLSLIEARLLAGDRDTAVADARSLAAAARDSEALTALGGILSRAGELALASQVLQESLDRSPSNPASWLEQARLLQRRADHEGAVQAAERAVRLAPERLEAVVGYAETLIGAQRHELAHDYLVSVRSRFEGRAEYCYTLGVALFGMHRYLESARALGCAVERDPSWSVAHFLLGTSWLAAGERRHAVEAYRAAIRADPLNPLNFVYLARAYDLLGPEFDEAAVEAAKGGLDLDPDNVECLTRVARHLLEHGDADEARKFLEKIVHAHPDLIKPRILLARAYSRLGMAGRASAESVAIRTLEAAQQERDAERGETAGGVLSPGLGLAAGSLP